MKFASRNWIALLGLIVTPLVSARGVSPYLPLDMSPDMQRQIERILILGGRPVMKRPIPAAVVLDALPSACEQDRDTCERVRRYLQTYMQKWGATQLQVGAAAVTGDSEATLPNRNGERVDSPWRVSASGYYQPNDYMLISAGGIAYDGNAQPTGSLVSLGFEFAQLDIGFRDHWYSPQTDSSSVISNEAPTMVSATLSNWNPLTSLNINYEIFAAQMSGQSGIRVQDGTTSGKPRLAGIQLAAEPVRGYSLALSRLTQYGGGARGGGGVSDFFDALFTSTNRQDQDGGSEASNRVAALTSSLLFPGKVPFAVRLEYAGDDNTYKGHYLLGATSFTVGLDLPVLWNSFDATFEVSEWQNAWYVHFLYPLGLTNEGNVIGHWFGDNRLFGDAIGGNSQMLRAGWRLASGDYVQAKYRSMALDSKWAGIDAERPYERLHSLGLSYATVWKGRNLDAELLVGRDIFGESFARLGAVFDFAATGTRASAGARARTERDRNTDVFVDIGAQQSESREIMLDQGPNVVSGTETNYHVGVGARRRVSTRNDLGVRLEIDEVDGYSLLSVRALDYRFRFHPRLALNLFFGAARYDIELPAYGYYWGGGLQYLDVFPGWDVGVDMRHHDKFTRDKVLPSDPPYTLQLPRRVLDVNGFSLYLSKRW